MGEFNTAPADPTSDLPTTPFDPNANISDQPTAVTSCSDASDAFRQAAIGSLLDGRYRVLDVKGGPGRSGMGVVYIVEAENKRYAAKTFQHQFARNLPLVQRFLREARTWILTGFHEHIVHAYFLDIIGAVPYLFMEYIESDPLGRISLADHLRKAPVPMGQAVEWAIQCCSGMIHATLSVPGLVHRDLKPENLLIAGGRALKITDFGLVRCHLAEGLEALANDLFATRPNITQVGTAFGTPAYMAPEQFVAADEVTESADIYAFGCCFYEAISGSRVFTIRADTALDHLLLMRRMHESEEPIPLRERVRECPQDIDRIIMRCLEKKPEDRWQSFSALRDELLLVQQHVLKDRPEEALWFEPSAEQVSEQLRSLTVLDGYSRAVRLQDLRDQQDTSPYAFHVALASYFRSMNESDEERRQLEKAVLCRTLSEGYEAVQRLAEVYLQMGEFSAARQVLDDFLTVNPAYFEACLEPVVHLHIVRQEFAEAAAVLDRFGTTLRTDLLRAALYRAQGKAADMATMWRRHVDELLETIRRKVAEIEAGDRVGWEHAGDAALLSRALGILLPAVDTSVLQSAEHIIWPRLAYPDFSGEMAWLSNALGELSESGCLGAGTELDTMTETAQLLGYPDRLPKHLARDETWFWSAEALREME